MRIGSCQCFLTKNVQRRCCPSHCQSAVPAASAHWPLKKQIQLQSPSWQYRVPRRLRCSVESVEQYGVLSPLIARPRSEGGYEIISGHRRQHAAQLAGLDTLPVIVRNMDDDAAILLMVDSNLQRENILPSERAFAYKMKLEALKNQGARSDLTSRQVGEKLWSVSQVSADANESERQVHRFIRLTNLIPELLDMVDEKKIAFNPAVELSYLDESQQPLARGSQPLGMSTGDTAFLRTHKSRAGFGT